MRRVSIICLNSAAILTTLRRYRRGKLESNDVDIVFTHPQGQGNKANNMIARLVERMRKDGKA